LPAAEASPAAFPRLALKESRPMAERLHALRGAISVERDEPAAILDSTTELMHAIMDRNELSPERVVSCIFTVTDDLTAEFPAVAARALGFEEVPLLCAREIPVPGSLPRVIRVLIHYYADHGHEPRHVYLRQAATLRIDLHAAQ
jgi:chorismate mutase